MTTNGLHPGFRLSDASVRIGTGITGPGCSSRFRGFMRPGFVADALSVGARVAAVMTRQGLACAPLGPRRLTVGEPRAEAGVTPGSDPRIRPGLAQGSPSAVRGRRAT